jgi:hypothetical protein
LWVGGLIGDVHALASKVFHFAVGRHDGPIKTGCEWLVCPVGNSMENMPTAPTRPTAALLSPPSAAKPISMTSRRGKTAFHSGATGRDLPHQECIGEAGRGLCLSMSEITPETLLTAGGLVLMTILVWWGGKAAKGDSGPSTRC